MDSNVSSCATYMITFQEAFKGVYGIIATVICVISIVFNICNIIILSHKQMISSTNCLLTGIAVSDLIKVVILLPMLLRFRVFSEHMKSRVVDPINVHFDEVSSSFWAGYYLSASIIPLISHTAALWLAVVLALFRYLCIKFYANPRIKSCFSLQRAKISICSVYVMVLIVLAPYFSIVFVNHKERHLVGLPSNQTILLYIGEIHPNSSQHLQDYSFWMTSVVGKFLPCIIMSIFGMLLIATLNATQERRESLVGDERSSNTRRGDRRSRDHRRTTRMLVTILILYSITEIPTAILAIFSQYNEFIYCLYMSLGEFLDLIALFNNTINFILYCMMSAKFREIFASMMCRFSPKLACCYEKAFHFHRTDITDMVASNKSRQPLRSREEFELTADANVFEMRSLIRE